MSEFTLLTIARRLGQPVGYEPEHGGDLVQNIVPTEAAVDRQVSTSSKVELMFHTEAAFHPHRPRYLLLLCLRGDPSAFTTLSSIFEVMPHLPRRRRRRALPTALPNRRRRELPARARQRARRARWPC